MENWAIGFAKIRKSSKPFPQNKQPKKTHNKHKQQTPKSNTKLSQNPRLWLDTYSNTLHYNLCLLLGY